MNETELIDYVQQAFHMEDEKHKQLLDIATMKEVQQFIYWKGPTPDVISYHQPTTYSH